MTLNTKIFSIISGCLLGLAFIFYVVSNAVPSWGKYEQIDATIGLWKTCGSNSGLSNVCVDHPCPPKEGITARDCDKVLAARAFVTLACIISAICALLLFASALLNENARRFLALAGKGLAFVCLIMGIIGVAIGINTLTGGGTISGIEIKINWGPSSIVGLIAIIINFVGAIISLFIV